MIDRFDSSCGSGVCMERSDRGEYVTYYEYLKEIDKLTIKHRAEMREIERQRDQWAARWNFLQSHPAWRIQRFYHAQGEWGCPRLWDGMLADIDEHMGNRNMRADAHNIGRQLDGLGYENGGPVPDGPK